MVDKEKKLTRKERRKVNLQQEQGNRLEELTSRAMFARQFGLAVDPEVRKALSGGTVEFFKSFFLSNGDQYAFVLATQGGQKRIEVVKIISPGVFSLVNSFGVDNSVTLFEIIKAGTGDSSEFLIADFINKNSDVRCIPISLGRDREYAVLGNGSVPYAYVVDIGKNQVTTHVIRDMFGTPDQSIGSQPIESSMKISRVETRLGQVNGKTKIGSRIFLEAPQDGQLKLPQVALFWSELTGGKIMAIKVKPGSRPGSSSTRMNGIFSVRSDRTTDDTAGDLMASQDISYTSFSLESRNNESLSLIYFTGINSGNFIFGNTSVSFSPASNSTVNLSCPTRADCPKAVPADRRIPIYSNGKIVAFSNGTSMAVYEAKTNFVSQLDQSFTNLVLLSSASLPQKLRNQPIISSDSLSGSFFEMRSSDGTVYTVGNDSIFSSELNDYFFSHLSTSIISSTLTSTLQSTLSWLTSTLTSLTQASLTSTTSTQIISVLTTNTKTSLSTSKHPSNVTSTPHPIMRNSTISSLGTSRTTSSIHPLTTTSTSHFTDASPDFSQTSVSMNSISDQVTGFTTTEMQNSSKPQENSIHKSVAVAIAVPTAVGALGLGLGVLGVFLYRRHQKSGRTEWLKEMEMDPLPFERIMPQASTEVSVDVSLVGNSYVFQNPVFEGNIHQDKDSLDGSSIASSSSSSSSDLDLQNLKGLRAMKVNKMKIKSWTLGNASEA